MFDKQSDAVLLLSTTKGWIITPRENLEMFLNSLPKDVELTDISEIYR